MGRKKKRSRKKHRLTTAKASFPTASSGVPLLGAQYHQPTFLRLHCELRLRLGDETSPPTIRHNFWRLILPRRYDSAEAHGFLSQYLNSIEDELKSLVAKNSITYWYHVYRRLAPGGIGECRLPVTISNTRAILDAAIQKYGQVTICNRIALSSTVRIDDVFGGEPRGKERAFIEWVLRAVPQLVLTNFTATELLEFYQAERLAYEIWWTSAILRSCSKGACLQVLDEPPYLVELRSYELAQLLDSYDARSERRVVPGLSETNTGTVFRNDINDGVGLLLQLNVFEQQISWSKEWLAEHGIRCVGNDVPKFIVTPVNLRNLLAAHRPLSAAFENTHGFSLEECLAVFGAIGLLPGIISEEFGQYNILRLEQMGYYGAFSIDRIESWIRGFVPIFMKSLGAPERAGGSRVREVLDWLTLTKQNREQITLAYPGPHFPLIPVGGPLVKDGTEFFVDHAWLYRRLRDLFHGVRVDDNNFKGAALECVTRADQMPLMNKQLNAFDGSSKQIDASFAVGTRLFIVECRAWPRSIGFERGQAEAVAQRRRKIDETLKSADDKAVWLARHPVGRNFDISNFSLVMPVGVTTLPEFIPSLFEWYWLRRGIPRVMTPEELEEELAQSTDETQYLNEFSISTPAPPGSAAEPAQTGCADGDSGDTSK
jgi:hypothetical protein